MATRIINENKEKILLLLKQKPCTVTEVKTHFKLAYSTAHEFITDMNAQGLVKTNGEKQWSITTAGEGILVALDAGRKTAKRKPAEKPCPKTV